MENWGRVFRALALFSSLCPRNGERRRTARFLRSGFGKRCDACSANKRRRFLTAPFLLLSRAPLPHTCKGRCGGERNSLVFFNTRRRTKSGMQPHLMQRQVPLPRSVTGHIWRGGWLTQTRGLTALVGRHPADLYICSYPAEHGSTTTTAHRLARQEAFRHNLDTKVGGPLPILA